MANNPRAQSLRVFPVYFRFVFYFRFLICVLLFCLRFAFFYLRFLSFLFAFSFFVFYFFYLRFLFFKLRFLFFICVFFFLIAFSFFYLRFLFCLRLSLLGHRTFGSSNCVIYGIRCNDVANMLQRHIFQFPTVGDTADSVSSCRLQEVRNILKF